MSDVNFVLLPIDGGMAPAGNKKKPLPPAKKPKTPKPAKKPKSDPPTEGKTTEEETNRKEEGYLLADDTMLPLLVVAGAAFVFVVARYRRQRRNISQELNSVV